MPGDEDDKPEVQLASVELQARQFRTRGPDHLWDLIGFVNFTQADVPTPYGVIRMTVNRATLRLDFDECEMPQADAGYVRQVPESRQIAVKESFDRDRTSGGKAAGRLKFGLTRGIAASGEVRGEMFGHRKADRKEIAEFLEIRNLVTFAKKDVSTKSMEWIVANVDTTRFPNEILKAIARACGKSTEDIVPEDLSAITQLELFGLTLNDLSVLSYLENLETLRLEKTKCMDFSGIAECIKLKLLRLDETNIIDLSVLSSLKDLETLTLGKTNIHDLLPVFALSNLRTLWINRTNVETFTPLLELEKLQWLDLDGTRISDLTPIGGLTNLTMLWLNRTQITDLYPITQLNNLTTLGLSQTKIGDLSPLTTFTNLRTLWLEGIEISDLGHLAGLINLEEVRLNSTSVHDLTPLAGLPNLRRLSLADTPVTDLVPLAGLTNLLELDLYNSQVSDIMPLSMLTNMRWLVLTRTRVSSKQKENLLHALPKLAEAVEELG